MLSWLVIAFLPRSKHLLISWLQSPSKVILEPKKIKSATVSTFSPSICHEMMGSDAMILVTIFIKILNGHIFLNTHILLSSNSTSVCVCMCVCICVHILSHVWLFVTPWTVACQASLSMGFSRQEYWSGLPFPAAGNLPTQGQNPCFLHWQVNSLPLVPSGTPTSIKSS